MQACTQACAAATESGARCQHLAVEGEIFCPTHLRLPKTPMAPRPNRVLVKFRVNERWAQRFRALGVQDRTPNTVRNDTKHAVEAMALGRDFLRYRDIPDSGVPVFGKQGASNVSLSEVWKALLEVEGYGIHEIHLEPARDNKWMTTLVITLIHGETPSVDVPAGVVEEVENFFSTASFGFVHVWANPPKADGTVVHTVNASHRQDAKAGQTLLFNNGLWNVSPMTS